ncbi:membrane protein insertion efficiency factor YidD [Coprothermobacteraceae bacterium]|nr:membrane protein insertion efficiency factor YidD [Coprothermobacteraceae bacterium]
MNGVAVTIVRWILRWYRFIRQLVLPGPVCRHTPTCSAYWEQAVAEHGFFVGSILGFWRVLRCNPLFPGGYDPVPKKGEVKILWFKV